jgi:signal recognition particle subunit SRP54
VNQLVNRFEQAAKMMKTVAKGGVPNIPGMGPMPGMRSGAKKQVSKQKSSKSGNPAKRAAENAALAAGAPAGGSGGGTGFGLGSKPAGEGGPSAEELEALQKMLGRG